MVKKLSKYGNSHAVLIDKPILELLNITENTQLKIKTDGTRIIIEPINEVRADCTCTQISDDEALQKVYEELVEKYEPALKKLAEN
jgi:antitoxin component of MazEF toxin-antitoxin module